MAGDQEDQEQKGHLHMCEMTIGGEIYIHMIINLNEKTFQIIVIGEEELGEMSIGGGIVKLEVFMIKSTHLQRAILDGGMEFLITKTYLHITWIFRPLGLDIIRIFQGYGEGIKPHPTGWLKDQTQDGIGNLTKNGNNFIKEKVKNGGFDLYQRK